MTQPLRGARATRMRAWTCRKYGGLEVLRVEEVPRPVPRDEEVLVRVVATTVNALDWRLRTGTFPRGFSFPARLALGLTGPRQHVLGNEVAGVVERVGARVARFRPGDEILASVGATMGAHAEYVLVQETGAIVHKPANVSFEDAATLPFGGLTALHFLREARVSERERVLVVGASGGAGTALVQVSRYMGAHVTGVTSTPNLGLVASLGAHAVIDYTRESLDERSGSYDVVADAVGALRVSRGLRLVRRGGRLISIVPSLFSLVAGRMTRRVDGKRVISGLASENAEALRELADLAAAGRIQAVIDRRYEFADLPAAHAYVATGRKRGSVVIRIGQGGTGA